MKKIAKILALASIALTLSTTQVMAASCKPLLDGLIKFLKVDKTGYIAFNMVMNSAKWSQYTTGQLHLKGTNSLVTSAGFPAIQYFSDRLWVRNTVTDLVTIPSYNPFNPDKTDALGLIINNTTSLLGNPTIKFTLLSWGNVASTSITQCDNNFMYGYTSDKKGMYVFTFTKVPGIQ